MNYYKNNNIFIVEKEDKYVLFHGISGHSDIVTRSLGELLLKQETFTGNEISQEDFQYLLTRNYITHLSSEEQIHDVQKYLTIQAQKYIKKRKTGYLMFMMTYDCNFKCPYCFENNASHKKSGYLSIENAQKIIDNIEKITEAPLENNSFTFYGGEPLLQRHHSTIEYILNRVSNAGINIDAVSNGYELNHYKNLLGPHAGQIGKIQISVDGAPAHHNQSRILHSGKPTFWKLIENIHMAVDQKCNISFRINATPKTLEGLDELMDILEQEELLGHPHFSPYIYPVSGDSYTDPQDLVDMLTLTNKIKGYEKTLVSPKRRAKNRIIEYFQNSYIKPPRRFSFCMMQNPNSMIMDHCGRIYGCYEGVGRDEEQIGEFSFEKESISWLQRRDLNATRMVQNLTPCLKCPAILICGGGCAIHAKRNHNGDSMAVFGCKEEKFLLQEAMKEVIS